MVSLFTQIFFAALLSTTICADLAHGAVKTEATRREVSLMLAAKTMVTTQAQREQLAAEILRQSECPLTVNQGRHNTCALAAVEARTYTLCPEAAAALIRQVATTGRYVTAGGDKIIIDPSNLQPDFEANSQAYGARSYASQLFQITAANIYWQTQEHDPRGVDCPRGSMRYIQKPISLMLSNDTGERLQILWADGTVETVVDDSGKPRAEPCITLPDVQKVATIVAQTAQPTFVIAGRKFDRSQKYIPVKSMADLRQKLEQSQKSHAMPLVAAVDSDRAWLANDRGWHAVCITQFNPASDTVSIDNFWGPHSDRVGEKAISLSELYSAISPN